MNAENRIAVDVKSYVDGDGPTGISAGSISLTANDSSRISAVAGAASISVSYAKSLGLTLSIAVTLSHNEISNAVEAFIINADEVEATNGKINITATSWGTPTASEVVDLNARQLTIAQLDEAGNGDGGDHSDTLEKIGTALDLQSDRRIWRDAVLTSNDGLTYLESGEVVELASDYDPTKGQPGRTYQFVGTNASINLTNEDYTAAAKWELVDAKPRLSTVTAGEEWNLVAPDGSSYSLTLEDDNKVTVVQNAIDSVAVAASLAVTLSKIAASLSGAGAESTNVILTSTNAYIDNSNITSLLDVDLLSQSDANILATVVAATLAGSFGKTIGIGASIGAAVANNYIGYNAEGNQRLATIQAYIKHSDVDTSGTLRLRALASQSISATVFAGSVAISASKIGIALSGSGVSAENKIGVHVKAYLEGIESNGIEAGKIILLAKDTSTINALAGAASIAASCGKVGISVGIGVSLATNTISSDVKAYVLGATGLGITTTSDNTATSGDLKIEAVNNATIDAVSFAAALAVAVSKIAVSLSGAGAEATNVILGSTLAYIEDSVVHVAGALDIDATNESKIDASIVSVAASLAVGSIGVGIAIGVAIARNFIGPRTEESTELGPNTLRMTDGVQRMVHNETRVYIEEGARKGDVYRWLGKTYNALGRIYLSHQDYGNPSLWQLENRTADSIDVHAYIEDSAINVTGALTVDALANQTINATIVAASAALSGGKIGVALSGAGASSDNRISVDVQAYIDETNSPANSGTVVADSITISARDTSTIDAEAIGAALAASFGKVGVSIAIGVSIANNKITNTVQAYIKDADTVATTGLTSDTGNIQITAEEKATIDADSVAASLAASFGMVAVSLSGAGADSTNVIANDVAAYISNSTVETDAGDVNVQALSTNTITAFVGAAALAVSGGKVAAAGAIGVSLGRNLIGYEDKNGAGLQNKVLAYISNSRVTVGAITSKANYSSAPNPAVDDANILVRPGELVLVTDGHRAGGTPGKVYRYQGPAMKSGEETTGDDNSPIEVTSNGHGLVTGDLVTIENVQGNTNANGTFLVTFINDNKFSLDGSTGNRDYTDGGSYQQVDLETENYTSGSWEEMWEEIGPSDILVEAKLKDISSNESFSGSVALAVGIGAAAAGAGAEATTKLGSKVEAYIKDSTATASGNITVEADGDSTIAKSNATGVAVAASLAGISVGASIVDNLIQNQVNAYVATNDIAHTLAASGAVSIKAHQSKARIEETNAVTASVAAGFIAVSGGGIVIEHEINNTISAKLTGPSTNPTAKMVTAGDISIEAIEDAYLAADATNVTVAVGLGAAIGVSLLDVTMDSDISAMVDQTNVDAANLTVLAKSDSNIDENSTAGVSASLVGAAGNHAKSIIKTQVNAAIDRSTIVVTGNVDVTATATNRARASAQGGAFGALAIGAMIAEITLGESHIPYEIVARVGNNTTITAPGALTIEANSKDDLLADSIAAGGGVVAAAGAESDVTANLGTLAQIGNDATINVGSLKITSDHNQEQLDTSADSYSLALASGSGAGAQNKVNTKADVDIGTNSNVTAGNIVILARNQLTKDQYSNSNNLRSGSAALANISVLQSETNIGTAGSPFQSRVNIGSGTTMAVEGTIPSPGVFEINAKNDIFAVDSVKVETVSGFGINAGISRIYTNSDAAIHVSGAKLTNNTGDIYLATKTDTKALPSANLLVVAFFAGSGGEATAVIKPSNTVKLQDTEIQARNLFAYAGRNTYSVDNLLSTHANIEMTTAALGGITVPVPKSNIHERNSVTVLGNSKLQALENVNFVATKGPGDERTKADGLAMNIAIPPYPIDISWVSDDEDISTNTVTIDSTAQVIAGLNNEALFKIRPLTILPLTGEGPGNPTIDVSRIGKDLPPESTANDLTDAEKTELGLPDELEYEYKYLNPSSMAFNVTANTVIRVVEGHTRRRHRRALLPVHNNQ